MNKKLSSKHFYCIGDWIAIDDEKKKESSVTGNYLVKPHMLSSVTNVRRNILERQGKEKLN